jgi:hypothetical protein
MINFDNLKFEELPYKLVDPTFRKLYHQNLILKIFWSHGLNESIGNDPEKVSSVQPLSYEYIFEAVKESFELSIYAND